MSHHLTADPTQQSCAEPDDDREAIHDFGDECGTEDDDRDTEQDTEDGIGEAVFSGTLSSCRDCKHVINGHDQVSNRDCFHGVPDLVFGFDFMATGGVEQQLDTDPHKHGAGDQFQERDVDQPSRNCKDHDSQTHSCGSTPEDSLLTLCQGNGGASHGNHNGVVAAEHDVQEDDFGQNGPFDVEEEIHLEAFSEQLQGNQSKS